MNNEPVAWMVEHNAYTIKEAAEAMSRLFDKPMIPLYTNFTSVPKGLTDPKSYYEGYEDGKTHPVKELTDKITEQEKFIKAILKKGGCDGNICQKYNANSVKELTDEEITEIFDTTFEVRDYEDSFIKFARAILRKAQEK